MSSALLPGRSRYASIATCRFGCWKRSNSSEITGIRMGSPPRWSRRRFSNGPSGTREDDDTAHELPRLGPVAEEDHRHRERHDRHEVRRHRGDTRADATNHPVEEREAADGHNESQIERVDPDTGAPADEVAVAL